MGLFIRKSLGKVGPVRFNLSKSGIGMSGGMRGARIGVGAKDAAILAREFALVFSAEDLMNLPHHHIYLRMMIDSKPTKPFSARVLELIRWPAI